jgi:CRISPR-associated protein Csb2
MPEDWPKRWVVRVAKARQRRTNPSPAPRIARYLRFSLQCHIPIPLRFTVPLAEQFRSAAIRNFSKIAGNGVSSFALSGHHKPENVEDEHQHAFYLPLGPKQGNGSLLEELHVWCAYGFTQQEIEALMCIQRLDWGGGKYPIRPVLMEINKGVPDDFPIAAGHLSSNTWRSRTPFVPPRYFYKGNLHAAKLKVKDAPEQQLAQCLKQAGIAVPGEIRRLTLNGSAQRFVPPLSAWDIVRTPEGEDEHTVGSVVTAVHVPTSAVQQERARRIGLFFEIAFEAPVTFSLPALGHSSHFGLGQFVPV